MARPVPSKIQLNFDNLARDWAFQSREHLGRLLPQLYVAARQLAVSDPRHARLQYMQECYDEASATDN